MDSYFQRCWALPTDCVRLIFNYATLGNELRSVRLRRYHGRIVNIDFFRRWAYVREHDNQVIVRDNRGRIRGMYLLI